MKIPEHVATFLCGKFVRIDTRVLPCDGNARKSADISGSCGMGGVAS